MERDEERRWKVKGNERSGGRKNKNSIIRDE